MKAAGITPPFDLVDETQSRGPSPFASGSIAIWQSPNWAASAGLLLVPAVPGGRDGGSSPCRARGQASRSPSTPKRSRRRSDDHFDVHLRKARDDLLAGLLVACRSIVDPSSCSRRSEARTFSSSPRCAGPPQRP